MDETSQRIIDATMELMKEKGYAATTTRDIALRSHVNECTLFRKFNGKKDIILSGIEQDKWRGNVSDAIFQDLKWDLQSDLEMFMRNYLERITADFVSLSVGLRAPQIYEETKPYIMKIPEAFLRALVSYFKLMHEKGKIGALDFECLALTVFSSTFGFTFLKASFGEQLSSVKQEEYIKNSVALFLKGIQMD
jgi:Transcriptional regulator